MATMTISMPDPMKDWIEAQIRNGDYASTSDYMRDLVRRDRARRGHEHSLEDLRQLVVESKASGISNLSVDEIFAEAERIAGSGALTGDDL